jgi:chaperonin GroES
MQFRPIGDHILVQPHTKEETTKGGILLPETVKEKPQTGTVVALGQGKYFGDELVTFEDMGIKKGDVVMFTKYGPTEIKIDDEDFLILEAHDILGVVEVRKN